MANAPSIEIVDATPLHIRALAESMQEDTAATAFKIGMTPKKVLWYSFRNSVICKTALIDGKVAAMWGVSGTVFSDTGLPWLVMAPEIEAHPFKVCFRYRQELNKMQRMFPVLEEWVAADNLRSIRLLEMMGFKVSKNTVPLGEAEFRKAERRIA